MLYVILGSTELANESLPADSSIRPHLQRALDAARRSKGLVEKILSFSRNEEMDLQPVQFDGLVSNAVGLLSALVLPPVKIAAEIDGDCGTVLAEAGRIEQTHSPRSCP